VNRHATVRGETIKMAVLAFTVKDGKTLHLSRTYKYRFDLPVTLFDIKLAVSMDGFKSSEVAVPEKQKSLETTDWDTFILPGELAP
jgi:hypothetical protein